MADARFIFEAVTGNFDAFARQLEAPMAKAATAAVKDADKLVKTDSKAAFAAAGFSGRSQNAMKSFLTPKTGDSINVAADFFLKPAYLNVFEQGATISGRPFLWLPTENVPFASGGKRLT